MAIRDTHDAQRPEYPLDQDVDRDQDRRQHAALGEHEPPEKVRERRLVLDLSYVLAHLPNPMRTAPITIDATSHRPNCDMTIRRDGTGLSNTLKCRITPARLKNVKLWYSANARHMTLKMTNAVELGG